MASKSARVGARALDVVVALVLAVFVLVGFGDRERPWAGLALVWLVVFCYELATVAWLGTSPGKRASGLRVVALDRVGTPELPVAARRAAAVASLTTLPVVGWAVWAATALGDPLGRGLDDRAAGTIVVPVTALLPVSTHDLPGYADGVRAPRITPRGRVGEVDVRGRARLRRLDDSAFLAVVIGLLALGVSLTTMADGLSLLSYVVGSTVLWLVCFVIDETRVVHRRGATPGQELAGLVIVDIATGRPPSTGRSLARAATLGLTLYVPVLWPVLAASVAMMRWSDTGRGLHDLAGRTVVVGDPDLDPETQRQRAMRMRLGTAG